MDSASKHNDNPKKRKSSCKTVSAVSHSPWVLVGTYKDGQLEAWPGFYNYPLKDDDDIGEEDGRKIGELWLFRGTQDQRTFDAEFVGVKTRDELVAEYAYPAKGKPLGSRYLLFKTAEKPNRGYLHGQKVICRLRDFKMSPSGANASRLGWPTAMATAPNSRSSYPKRSWMYPKKPFSSARRRSSCPSSRGTANGRE